MTHRLGPRRGLAFAGLLGLILFTIPWPAGQAQEAGKATMPGAPRIDRLIPDSGPASGGCYLLLEGANFDPDETTVLFGDEEANDVIFVSSTQLKVEAPSGPTGTRVDVTVTVRDQPGSSARRAMAFRYEGLSSTLILALSLSIVLLALMGLPLFLVIGGACALGYLVTSQQEGLGFMSSLSDFGQAAPGLGSTIFNWVTDMGGKPLFIAIPLFTFAGSLMSESQAPTRLVNVARSLIGWIPGGLAWVTLIVCCFFTAFTGASGVTIIALGGLLFPIMLKEGYSENYSLGLLTTGGSLGLLIPPSLPVIVYGIIAGLDTDRIWDAGLGPMILIVGILGAHAVVHAITAGVPRHPISGSELWSSLRAAAFELPLPFVVVFGIKGGVFTPTEASAVTALWVLLTEVFIYRDIAVSELPGAIRRSMTLVGSLIVIIGLALAFTTYLTRNEVPQYILGVMQRNIDSQLAFLLMLNGFLLIVGCLMDIFSAILVVVPLVAPVATGFGVDPYHLAIIFLVNLEIGYSTPPVGINLFISSLRFGRPVFQLYRASFVFIGLLLCGLAVITYAPALSIGRFDLPAVRVLDSTDREVTKLRIVEGTEDTLRGHVSLGGEDLAAARAAKARAAETLEGLEASTELDYAKLTSSIAWLDNRLVEANLSPDERLKSESERALLLTKRAPLEAAAVELEERKKACIALTGMASRLGWRCRLDPEFSESGEELDLSLLEPGRYILIVSAQSEKKHLAQASIEVEVAPDPDHDEDDEDDEDDE